MQDGTRKSAVTFEQIQIKWWINKFFLTLVILWVAAQVDCWPWWSYYFLVTAVVKVKLKSSQLHAMLHLSEGNNDSVAGGKVQNRVTEGRKSTRAIHLFVRKTRSLFVVWVHLRQGHDCILLGIKCIISCVLSKQ